MANLMKASDLKDAKVKNKANEDIGKIDDFMIHLDSGKIAYAVLSFGGVLGIGNKLFAVPWPAISLDRDRRELILDIAKERLQDAPGFDKDSWPDMADTIWGESIHKYYGQKYSPTDWQR